MQQGSRYIDSGFAALHNMGAYRSDATAQAFVETQNDD
jgi:predicted house-cleaning NTP pyrophosphatase (Maf/HAM1 superfamily)